MEVQNNKHSLTNVKKIQKNCAKNNFKIKTEEILVFYHYSLSSTIFLHKSPSCCHYTDQ